MTSLTAWIGVDSRGPSSAYFASDSRITWAGRDPWDHGRKLFASRKYPHILAYCGDVLFPTQILGQVRDMIDAGLVVDAGDGIDACADSIMSAISEALQTYHAQQGFDLLYCMREGEGMSSKFQLRQITFELPASFRISQIEVPKQSEVVAVLGSGRPGINVALDRWKLSGAGCTSRAVFSAFCDSLRSGTDPLSGGPPQLVGLFRSYPAKTFGVIWEQRRYFYGLGVNETSRLGDVQWYNDLFEICDPITIGRNKDAQHEPRPTGL